MITHPQVMLLAGLLLLSDAAALAYIGCKARRGQPLFQRHSCRLRLTTHPLTQLRRCLFLKADAPELSVLHSLGQTLTEELIRLRHQLRELPPLPGDHEPRIMGLARRIVAEESLSTAVMERMLRNHDDVPLTSVERLALPVCTAAAQCESLSRCLDALQEDARDRMHAIRLSAQLSRSKRPLELLTRHPLSLTGISFLLAQLRSQHQDVLLELIGEWLAGHGTDAACIAECAAQRQAAITKELHRAAERFQMLSLMDWEATAEASNPLHTLMLKDPSGVYQRMSRLSRQQYCRQAELLSQYLKIGPEALLSAAVSLCERAETSSLEAHIGWYLWEWHGIRALIKELSLRRGRLCLLLLINRQLLLRTICLGFSTLCAVLFLNDGEPLFLLPFFLTVTNQLVYSVMTRMIRPAPLHTMNVTAVTDELRTLVILPVMLTDTKDVMQALRFLRSAACAFPKDGVDLMLMADPAPAITRTISKDQAIITAAAQGIAALSSEGDAHRFLYMHRARCWLPAHNTFAARDARTGAIETLCRLIAQGECEDIFEYSSLSPANLHRRYSFVLALDMAEIPVPGLLEKLLAAASHPLNTPLPTPVGMRGWSCFSPVASSSGRITSYKTRLIRPDAFLEALDGAVPDKCRDNSCLVCDAVSGVRYVSGAVVSTKPVTDIYRHLERSCQRTREILHAIRWMLPWGHIIGITGRAIPSERRYALRNDLRSCMLPLCRIVLLAWALIDRNVPMLLIALAPLSALETLLTDPRKHCQILEEIVMLPTLAASAAFAAWSVLCSAVRKNGTLSPVPANWQSFEFTSQGAAILACLTASMLNPFWLPALIPASCFSTYPLLHLHHTRRLVPENPLPTVREPALRHIAEATWQCFLGPQLPTQSALPPSCVQTSPVVTMCAQISPEAAGMYLLSLVCARELGFLSTEEAARSIASSFEKITQMALRHGLPCRMYSLPDLTPVDKTIGAHSCGILLVSLITCAQALRAWLPELPSDLHGLPAALDEYAHTLDIIRLYDACANRFFLSLDEDGQGHEHAIYLCDVTLLLSFAARAYGLIPPEHLSALSRTCTEACGDMVPLSHHGDLAAYLLPGLFLPIDEDMARRVILLHQKHGIHGIWGRSESAAPAFTPDLRYRRCLFGLREIASGDPPDTAVFAPYAAALALPYAPNAALDCLTALQETTVWGPYGFYDSIDLTDKQPQCAFTQDTCHQALILCAAAHVLADAPLRRYFADLPIVQACLPLLDNAMRLQIKLPPRPVRSASDPERTLPERIADASQLPLDAHLIGSKSACILMNALGSSRMLFDGLLLNSFRGSPLKPEGMQVFLTVSDRVYRITDPNLPGRMIFSGGCIHSERLCGCLRAVMTVMTDQSSGQILHLIEITNLSTDDCHFDAADLLPADLFAAAQTQDALHPSQLKLILHDRASGNRIYHQASFEQTALQVNVCTDQTSFTGRGRTLHDPASLEEPMADLLVPSCADCLSFRASFTLGGRAQTRILFATGLSDEPLPSWQELPGLINIAEMHARAVADAIPLSHSELDTIHRMAGPLFCRGLPHQGATTPLKPDAIHGILRFLPPLLTLTVPDDASFHQLRELLRASAWFSLHGQSFTMYVLCTASTEEAVHAAIHTSLISDDSTDCHIITDASPDTAEALFAISNLVIRGDGRSLSAQLASLKRPVYIKTNHHLPSPGILPDLHMVNVGGYGGFDPDNGDYLIRLAAGQATPVSWMMHLHSRSFSLTADEGGVLLPALQHLTLSLNGSAPFNPLHARLPTLIRVGHGWLRWRVYAENFVMTLDASCLTGFPAVIQSLRIRNTGRDELQVDVAIAADLASSSQTHLKNIGDAVFASGQPGGCLVGCSDALTADFIDAPAISADFSGITVGRLSAQLSINAGASSGVAWLLGTAGSADESAAAQKAVLEGGAAACIRSARERARKALPGVSISTPEPTLDLLVNHVLPRQVLNSGQICLISALTDPEGSRQLLLRESPSGIFPVAMRTALYLALTGDAAILDQTVSSGETLQTKCRTEILAHNPDTRQECSPKYLCNGILAAVSAKILLSFTEDEALAAHQRTLLQTAGMLWHADHHSPAGNPLLSVQACTALALGNTPRVHKGLNTCWDLLYDRAHGLIQEKTPDDSPACKGTPSNGGQITSSAVLFLTALTVMRHDHQAWELLRALNPLHHTDDPVRSEEFAGPPWLLPAGIHAAPSIPGRAEGEDAAAADLLLALIINRFLGLSFRQGDLIMQPIVPPDWDTFAVTLNIGTSTWHISMERDLTEATCDGLPMTGNARLTDDGKIHQLRLPLKEQRSSV